MIIEYKTFKDLKEAVLSTDYEISKLVIDNILSNPNFKEKMLVASLYAEDLDAYIDLSLNPDDLEECLNCNLKIMEDYEDFDRCINIVNLLKEIGS